MEDKKQTELVRIKTALENYNDPNAGDDVNTSLQQLGREITLAQVKQLKDLVKGDVIGNRKLKKLVKG